MSDQPTQDFDVAGPIITKFGGVNGMSKDTGMPYGRIDGWAKAKNIPERWRPVVLRHAKRLGVPHTPWDYIAHLVTIPDDVAA